MSASASTTNVSRESNIYEENVLIDDQNLNAIIQSSSLGRKIAFGGAVALAAAAAVAFFALAVFATLALPPFGLVALSTIAATWAAIAFTGGGLLGASVLTAAVTRFFFPPTFSHEKNTTSLNPVHEEETPAREEKSFDDSTLKLNLKLNVIEESPAGLFHETTYSQKIATTSFERIMSRYSDTQFEKDVLRLAQSPLINKEPVFQNHVESIKNLKKRAFEETIDPLDFSKQSLIQVKYVKKKLSLYAKGIPHLKEIFKAFSVQSFGNEIDERSKLDGVNFTCFQNGFRSQDIKISDTHVKLSFLGRSDSIIMHNDELNIDAPRAPCWIKYTYEVALDDVRKKDFSKVTLKGKAIPVTNPRSDEDAYFAYGRDLRAYRRGVLAVSAAR